ncbi:MAG: hypothetical protein K9H34_08245 [Actinomycetia bacterium]|nr:hypothetical protein [Actinomycetes bacterium]
MDSGRRGGRRVAGAALSLVLVAGGVGVGWWLIGDLTESGVLVPSYLVRAPEWAEHHPRRIGLVGCLLIAVGLVANRFLVTRRIDRSAQIRLLVVRFLCVVDGFFIGLILRLLTIGTDGASFIGLTIFFGLPPTLVLTVILLVVGDRLIGPGKQQ